MHNSAGTLSRTFFIIIFQIGIVMKNKEKEEGQRIRAKVEKIQFDEKSSKYFFSREKARAETKQITILRNKDKKGLEDKESILKEIQNFYTTLYTAEGIDINQVNANLKFIDKTLSSMDNKSLNDFISHDEIKKSHKRHEKRKKPRRGWNSKRIL